MKRIPTRRTIFQAITALLAMCSSAAGQTYEPLLRLPAPAASGAAVNALGSIAGQDAQLGLPAAQTWIQPPPPVEPLVVPLAIDEQSDIATTETETVVAEPVAVGFFNPWTGGFEFGLSGSDGNSETFTLRFGGDGKTKTPWGELSLDLTFSKGSNNGVESEHEVMLDGRHEWQWKESPWTAFVHGTAEYDEFRAFDIRLAADAGLGYSLIKTDATKLTARAGGGFSREVGGPDDSYVPEGLAGLEFERQLTKRQKVTISVEYFPDVTDPQEFRANSKAAWEMLVDPQMNLNLKLSVTDRYDSTPNGAKRNDLDYSLLLLWKY